MQEPAPHPSLLSLLGARFWVIAVVAVAALAFVLAELLIQMDGFEAFYEYTRDHEDWNLDEWAMAALATLLSVALIGSVVVIQLTRRLLKAEAERQTSALQLQQSRSLVALGTMVAGTAHSINNHLMPVIALADLVRTELPANSAHARDLEKVLAAARSAAEIVARMKTFAKTNHAVKGVCQVALASQVAVDLARNVVPSSARLVVHIAPLPYHVAVSASAWEIVLLNLINNAADALEGRTGTIEVSLQAHDVEGAAEGGAAGAPATSSTSASAQGRPWVRLQVNDTGKGMEEAELRRIFEPFFTTKGLSKGTGLGLPESQGIVDSAGGRFEVSSTPGKGTQIAVWLPTVPSQEPKDQ